MHCCKGEVNCAIYISHEWLTGASVGVATYFHACCTCQEMEMSCISSGMTLGRRRALYRLQDQIEELLHVNKRMLVSG